MKATVLSSKHDSTGYYIRFEFSRDGQTVERYHRVSSDDIDANVWSLAAYLRNADREIAAERYGSEFRKYLNHKWGHYVPLAQDMFEVVLANTAKQEQAAAYVSLAERAKRWLCERVGGRG